MTERGRMAKKPNTDLRNSLAKARDSWIESHEGKTCAVGNASGIYLQNRLECAFIAGWNACENLYRRQSKVVSVHHKSKKLGA